jgi:hypothetical protein
MKWGEGWSDGSNGWSWELTPRDWNTFLIKSIKEFQSTLNDHGSSSEPRAKTRTIYCSSKAE